MINEVFQAIGLTSMIAIIVFLFVFFNKGVEKKIRRMFLEGLFLIFGLVVVDAVEVATRIRPTYSSARMISTIVGYCTRPMLAFIVEVVMLGEQKFKNHILLSIPIILNIVIVTSALYTPIAFYYTANNEFIRGPLGYTPFVVAIFYLVVLAFIGYDKKRDGNQNETYVAEFIGLLCIISTFMEWKFQLVGIISGACCVSIICFYLYYYVTFQDKDMLTGAYVRKRLMIDATNNMHNIDALMSIDLNDLKLLNDRMGHSVGDKALQTLTKEVNMIKPHGWEVYRVGGDEFTILCYKTESSEIEEFISELQKAMKEKQYSVACGYAMFEDGDSLETISERADHAMYANKALMKGDLAYQQYQTV